MQIDNWHGLPGIVDKQFFTGAVLLAMLTLAKDRIVSSMRSAIIRGRTFITIVAAIITVACVLMTVRFTLVLIDLVNNPVTSVGP